MILLYRPDNGILGFVGPVENTVSVVWTERWQDYDDAQIALPVDVDIRIGDFLTMPGHVSAMRVTGRTETPSGIEVRCEDALAYLDKRIVYPTVQHNGLLRDFIAKMLAPVAMPSNPEDITERTLKLVTVGDLSAITRNVDSIQRSYGKVGETLLSLGRQYGFDPICTISGGKLVVSARVNSTERTWLYGNAVNDYTVDVDLSKNSTTAYVGGQVGEDGQRQFAIAGDETLEDDDRTEEFFDRRDLERPVGLSYDDLVATYGSNLNSCSGAEAYTVTSGSSSPYTLEDVIFRVYLGCGGVGWDMELSLKSVLTSTAWASLSGDVSLSDPTTTYSRVA